MPKIRGPGTTRWTSMSFEDTLAAPVVRRQVGDLLAGTRTLDRPVGIVNTAVPERIPRMNSHVRGARSNR